MRTMIQRTKRHRTAVLRRLAIVLALATTLLLGALSTAALATPRTAPARPATHTAATPPADQPAPAARPAAAILPFVLGAIVILAAYNNPPRYHHGSH
jgi:hypothetical protein